MFKQIATRLPARLLASLALLLSPAGCFFDFTNPAEDIGAGEIRGRVVQQSGEELVPFEGALVSIEGSPLVTRSDALGRFTFAGLTEGVYNLAVVAASNPQAPNDLDLRALLIDVDVPVSDGRVVGDVVLQAAGSLTGNIKLMGQPAAENGGIRLFHAGTCCRTDTAGQPVEFAVSTPEVAVTADDGAVSLSYVTPGEQIFVAAFPGYRSVRIERTINAGQDTALGDIVLEPLDARSLGVAFGTALLGLGSADEDNSGISISLVLEQRDPTLDSDAPAAIDRLDITADDGSYTINDVPEGIYTLVARKEGFDAVVRPNVAIFGGTINQALRDGSVQQAQGSGTRLPTVVLPVAGIDCDRDGTENGADMDDDNDGTLDSAEDMRCECNPAGFIFDELANLCIPTIVTQGGDRNSLPVARINRPSETTIGLEVEQTFTHSSFDADGDDIVVDWRARGPDGATIASSNDAELKFTPSEAGQYTVILRAFDGRAASLEDILVLQAVEVNLPPVISLSVSDEGGTVLTSPASVPPGVRVELDACDTTDPNGHELQFFWSPRERLIIPGENNPNECRAQVSTNMPQTLNIELLVQEVPNQGPGHIPAEAMESFELTILDSQPPEVTITTPAEGTIVPLNHMLTFEGSANVADLPDTAFTWSVGGDNLANQGPSIEYTFDSAGTQTVTLEVVNDALQTGDASVDVEVLPGAIIGTGEPFASCGQVIIGQDGFCGFSFSNPSDRVLEYTFTVVEPGDPAALQLESDDTLSSSITISVDPSNSSSVPMSFRPTAAQDYDFTVEYSVGPVTFGSFSVSGAGIEPPPEIDDILPRSIPHTGPVSLVVLGRNFNGDESFEIAGETLSPTDSSEDTLVYLLEGGTRMLGMDTQSARLVPSASTPVDAPFLFDVHAAGGGHLGRIDDAAPWHGYGGLLVGAGSGLYHFEQGVARRLGPKFTNRGVHGVAVSPADARTLYVVTDEILVSRDAGQTFAPCGRPQGIIFSGVYAHLQDPTRGVAFGDGGVQTMQNEDATTVSGLSEREPNVTAVALDPSDPDRFFFSVTSLRSGGDAGIWEARFSTNAATRIFNQDLAGESTVALTVTSGDETFVYAFVNRDFQDAVVYRLDAAGALVLPRPLPGTGGDDGSLRTIVGPARSIDDDHVIFITEIDAQQQTGCLGEPYITQLSDLTFEPTELPMQQRVSGDPDGGVYSFAPGEVSYRAASATFLGLDLNGLDTGSFQTFSAHRTSGGENQIFFSTADLGDFQNLHSSLSVDGGANFAAFSALPPGQWLTHIADDGTLYLASRGNPAAEVFLMQSTGDLDAFSASPTLSSFDGGLPQGQSITAVSTNGDLPAFVAHDGFNGAFYAYRDIGEGAFTWRTLIPSGVEIFNALDFAFGPGGDAWIVTPNWVTGFRENDQPFDVPALELSSSRPRTVVAPNDAFSAAHVGSEEGLLQVRLGFPDEPVVPTSMLGVDVQRLETVGNYIVGAFRDVSVMRLFAYDGAAAHSIGGALFGGASAPFNLDLAATGDRLNLHIPGSGVLRDINVAELVAAPHAPRLVDVEWRDDGDGGCDPETEGNQEGFFFIFDESVEVAEAEGLSAVFEYNGVAGELEVIQTSLSSPAPIGTPNILRMHCDEGASNLPFFDIAEGTQVQVRLTEGQTAITDVGGLPAVRDGEGSTVPIRFVRVDDIIIPQD